MNLEFYEINSLFLQIVLRRFQWRQSLLPFPWVFPDWWRWRPSRIVGRGWRCPPRCSGCPWRTWQSSTRTCKQSIPLEQWLRNKGDGRGHWSYRIKDMVGRGWINLGEEFQRGGNYYLAIWYRLSLRMSSVVLPENIGPMITWIWPFFRDEEEARRSLGLGTKEDEVLEDIFK